MTTTTGTICEVSSTELHDRLSDGAKEDVEAAGSDRRRARRISAQWAVDVPFESWPQAQRIYMANISAGGLLLSLSGPSRIPGSIRVTLRLPDGRELSLAGDVRHVSPADDGAGSVLVGVQFDRDDREGLDALARLLAEQL